MRGDICSIPNCTKITKYGDICEMHLWRLKTFNSYDLPEKEIKTCRAPNCDRFVDKKQNSRLCVTHRVRWSRHKSFDLPLVVGLPDGIVKICEIHGERTHDQAYKVPNSNHYNCRACRKVSADKYKNKNPNRIITFNNYYVGKGKIKVTKKQYETLFKMQDGLCKICKNPETICHKNGTFKRLAIDHCHTSESHGIVNIRGLLCQMCNQGLGHFKDSIEFLKSAIEYLDQSKLSYLLE